MGNYVCMSVCLSVCMSVCSPKALKRVEMDYWYQYNYCSASPWEGFRPIKNLKIEKKKYITKIVTMVTDCHNI